MANGGEREKHKHQLKGRHHLHSTTTPEEENLFPHTTTWKTKISEAASFKDPREALTEYYSELTRLFHFGGMPRIDEAGDLQMEEHICVKNFKKVRNDFQDRGLLPLQDLGTQKLLKKFHDDIQKHITKAKPLPAEMVDEASQISVALRSSTGSNHCKKTAENFDTLFIQYYAKVFSLPLKRTDSPIHNAEAAALLRKMQQYIAFPDGEHKNYTIHITLSNNKTFSLRIPPYAIHPLREALEETADGTCRLSREEALKYFDATLQSIEQAVEHPKRYTDTRDAAQTITDSKDEIRALLEAKAQSFAALRQNVKNLCERSDEASLPSR